MRGVLVGNLFVRHVHNEGTGDNYFLVLRVAGGIGRVGSRAGGVAVDDQHLRRGVDYRRWTHRVCGAGGKPTGAVVRGDEDAFEVAAADRETGSCAGNGGVKRADRVGQRQGVACQYLAHEP